MGNKTIKDKAVYEVFNEYFAHIDEPRQLHKIKHLLNELLFMIVLAVISGADDFHEIEKYAKKKERWLSTFLTLPKGIPSHDTFNRILCMIDAEQFEQSFVDWTSDLRNSIEIPEELSGKDIVNLDGKVVCNSRDNSDGTKAINMVSALSTKHGLVLGQQKCYEKSNEITAIPKLLKMLHLAGTIITIDAIGCQKNIASDIIKKCADYILAVKGNQGNLHKEIIDLFDKVNTDEFAHYIHQKDVQVDKGHGRIETRECITIQNLKLLSEVDKWKAIKSIAKITATVIKKGKETKEDRYYITSLNGNANFINRAVRKHWSIENQLHWILDVIFKEDYCRVRKGNGAENFTIIRKIAYNAIKRDNTEKASFKNKRKMCGWDDNYSLNILMSSLNYFTGNFMF